jgi:uncharacterized protein YdaU (DUF1376 family)
MEIALNFYPFHLGDYATHTAHLDLIEDLAYRRLLDCYYLHEAPLPLDVTRLATLVRMRDHAATVRDILTEFFVCAEDGWHHTRCDAELAKMKDKREKAQASAKASANVRSANAQRTLSERSTNAELPIPVPIPIPVKNTKRGESASKGTRLQADACLTSEMHDFCKTERPDLNPDTVWANFRDFWIAKPGKDGTKLDWLATWRTWVRREAKQKAPQESFYERERRLKREEWEKMTGRRWPEDNVIDGEVEEIFGRLT